MWWDPGQVPPDFNNSKTNPYNFCAKIFGSFCRPYFTSFIPDISNAIRQFQVISLSLSPRCDLFRTLLYFKCEMLIFQEMSDFNSMFTNLIMHKASLLMKMLQIFKLSQLLDEQYSSMFGTQRMPNSYIAVDKDTTIWL